MPVSTDHVGPDVADLEHERRMLAPRRDQPGEPMVSGCASDEGDVVARQHGRRRQAPAVKPSEREHAQRLAHVLRVRHVEVDDLDAVDLLVRPQAEPPAADLALAAARLEVARVAGDSVTSWPFSTKRRANSYERVGCERRRVAKNWWK